MADHNDQLPPDMKEVEKSADGRGRNVQQAIERFRALPKRTQIILVGVFVILFVLVFSGGQDAPPPAPPQQETQQNLRTNVANLQGEDEGAPFSGVSANRPALTQRWLRQQQQALANMREDNAERFEQLEQNIDQRMERVQSLELQVRQMLDTIQEERVDENEQRQRDRDVMFEMIEEMRQLQQKGRTGALGVEQSNQPSRRRGRITQTPLGSSRGLEGPQGDALLGGIVNQTGGGEGRQRRRGGLITDESEGSDDERLPFVPPLGFVKATLLNGFDALAGGGEATPALARLSGKYRTSKNSTVDLDGCFVLMEFEGDISTERAVGRPSRMTCVYPDQGAVTYETSGYVVDARDGIIGVPGVFYEGNASRIAMAMAADFAAGVAQVVNQNQQTFVTTPEGDTTVTPTGSQTRAEISGGVENAVGRLRDYLVERAERILPFVRVDSTRDIHIVFLSGNELRTEGSPWTLLFDASGR